MQQIYNNNKKSNNQPAFWAVTLDLGKFEGKLDKLFRSIDFAIAERPSSYFTTAPPQRK
jgi:hypothetical protein